VLLGVDLGLLAADSPFRKLLMAGSSNPPFFTANLFSIATDD
jgi:hypothetical protein